MVRVPAQPGPVIGVAVIEPRSDVADLTEAMRHVLHPTGDVGTALVMPAVVAPVVARAPRPEPAARGPGPAATATGAALRAADSPGEIDDTVSQPDARADRAGAVQPPDGPRDLPAPSVDTPADSAGSGSVGPPDAPGGPIEGTAAVDGDDARSGVLTPWTGHSGFDPGGVGTLLSVGRAVCGAVGDHRPDLNARLARGAVGGPLPPGEVRTSNSCWAARACAPVAWRRRRRWRGLHFAQ